MTCAICENYNICPQSCMRLFPVLCWKFYNKKNEPSRLLTIANSKV